MVRGDYVSFSFKTLQTPSPSAEDLQCYHGFILSQEALTKSTILTNKIGFKNKFLVKNEKFALFILF